MQAPGSPAPTGDGHLSLPGQDLRLRYCPLALSPPLDCRASRHPFGLFWTLFMGWVIKMWSLRTLGTKLQSFSGLPAFQFPSPIAFMGKAASGEVRGKPKKPG